MRTFIHDRYAGLSHKSALGDGVRRPGVKSWVPPDDARRLAAYQLLAALRDNVSRYFLPDTYGDAQVAKFREYGHGGRLVIAARTSLLGDEQTLVAPALGRDSTADKAVTDAATKALEWLRGWAVKERLWLKMNLAENDAVSLGDGVYTLGWNSDRGRPKLRRYDPGFYFPDLRAGDPDDFPSRVHLAWEENDLNGRPQLHRLTWRLGAIRPALDPDRPYGELMYAFDPTTGRPVPQEGDQLDKDGRLVRTYPWDPTPSSTTCYFSHGVWDLGKIKGDLHVLDERFASWQIGPDGVEQRELDLHLDFVPVVHVPNTPAGEEHFGQSILTLVAQLLDDLAAADTDLAETGALAGSATLVTKGATPVDLQAGPGSRMDLPSGATAEYLDTSKNLDALLKLNESLKDTLSENSRVSKVSLGRVDAGNAPSGLALALSFSPEEGLVRELRAVRDEKYPLLLKMALRMAQQAGVLPAGSTPEAQVQFGSFLPSDQAQAVEQVTAALEAGVMSQHTAVLTLQKAGFPIEDAEAEVQRIRREQISVETLLELGPEGEALIWKILGLTPPPGLAEAPEPDEAETDES